MLLDSDDWTVQETFKSKKNSVQRIEYRGKDYVVKKYDQEFIDGLEKELDLLRRCEEKGIAVPEVLESSEDTLILEYIPGESCKELYDTTIGDEKKKEILSEIADWLSRFHTSFEERRGDSILANFILSEDKIYGIDFEEAEENDHLRDVGDLCASILRLRPAFTEKRFSMVDHFIEMYLSSSSKDRTDLTDKVVGSLEHYARYSSDGELMKRWAGRIQQDGLTNIPPERKG